MPKKGKKKLISLTLKVNSVVRNWRIRTLPKIRASPAPLAKAMCLPAKRRMS